MEVNDDGAADFRPSASPATAAVAAESQDRTGESGGTGGAREGGLRDPGPSARDASSYDGAPRPSPRFSRTRFEDGDSDGDDATPFRGPPRRAVGGGLGGGSENAEEDEGGDPGDGDRRGRTLSAWPSSLSQPPTPNASRPQSADPPSGDGDRPPPRPSPGEETAAEVATENGIAAKKAPHPLPTMTTTRINTLRDRDIDTEHRRRTRPPDPLTGSSPLSRILFSWAHPLLRTGYSRPLEEIDLPSLPPEESSRSCLNSVASIWEEEKRRKSNRGGGGVGSDAQSLFRALLRWYFCETIPAMALLLLTMAARVGQAIALRELLDSLNDRDGRAAYAWASTVILCGLVSFICKQSQFFITYRVGARMRTGIVASVFAKALTLPSVGGSGGGGGAPPGGVGAATNLASNDAERFVLFSVYGIFAILGPLEAIVSTIVGVLTIGPAFAAGPALLLTFFVPLQLWLGRRFGELRGKIASLTDARVGAVSRVARGARVVKMSGWETRLSEEIGAVRRKETLWIESSGRCKGANEATYYVAGVVSSAAVFAAHVWTGGTLTPGVVFASMTLLNIMQMTVAKTIPYALMGLAECRVSCRRIQAFLEAPDHRLTGASSFSGGDSSGESRGADGGSEEEGWLIRLRDVTCHWDAYRRGGGAGEDRAMEDDNQNDAGGVDEEEDIRRPSTRSDSSAAVEGATAAAALINVNLILRPGALHLVIGRVGSGKSALLQALAGELPPSSGVVERRRRRRRPYGSDANYEADGGGAFVSYAPQDPWIMNGTIRENVTLGSGGSSIFQEGEEGWYCEVMDACGLAEDLGRLPDGDRTVVGDRGVQLSGGQR